MKGLEALNSLIETMPFAFLESNTMKELKIIEKELRALEIIKEKISPLARYTFLPMTQEEFELVEEILK